MCIITCVKIIKMSVIMSEHLIDGLTSFISTGAKLCEFKSIKIFFSWEDYLCETKLKVIESENT